MTREEENLRFIQDTLSKIQKRFHYTSKEMRIYFPDLINFYNHLRFQSTSKALSQDF